MLAPSKSLIIFPLLALNLACAGRGSPTEDDVSTDTVEVRKVPLDSVYSTTDQTPPLKAAHGEASLEELYRYSHEFALSNVFLARGEDIGEAIKATARVFAQGESVRQAVPPDGRPTSEKFWLVSYFGVQDGGQLLLVKSVAVWDRSVRVVYKWAVIQSANELRTCFAWAPVGTLVPGTYRLELYDEDKQHVTLSRRVSVP